MKNRFFSASISLLLILLLVTGTAPVAFAADTLSVSATYGDTLDDIELPDGYTWSADDPGAVSVGNVGTRTFPAQYTADGGNVEATVSVEVSPAYISEIMLQTDGSQYYTGNPGEPEIRLLFKGAALVKDRDYTVSYESVDSGIAKVTVEGIGNFTGKTSLTVHVEKQDVQAVEISRTEAELTPGMVCQLTASVVPATATFKDVVWFSSDETVAVVDKDGLVRAIRNGEATITAESKDGGFTAECAVTVKTYVSGVTIPVGKVRLRAKETYPLKAIVVPYDASNKDVIWTSADECVAKVDENGVVTAIKRGDTVITATTADGELVDTCEITVRYSWWQMLIWLCFGCLWYFK